MKASTGFLLNIPLSRNQPHQDGERLVPHEGWQAEQLPLPTTAPHSLRRPPSSSTASLMGKVPLPQ